MGNGFRLQGREYNLAVVHNEDRPGLAAKGSVDERIPFPRFLHKALNGRRFGTNNRYDLFTHDHIAKTDIQQVEIHIAHLLYVLYLFTDLFNFIFQLQDRFRYGQILRLGTDGIRFTVHFLNEEIELPPYSVVFFQKALQLDDVAAETDDFFRKIDFISINSHFFEETVLIRHAGRLFK